MVGLGLFPRSTFNSRCLARFGCTSTWSSTTAGELWWWVGGWPDLVRTRPRPKEKIDRTDLPPNPSTTPPCELTDPARLGSGSSGLYNGMLEGLGMPKKCHAVQQVQQNAEEWPHCKQAKRANHLSLRPPQEQDVVPERRRQRAGPGKVGGLQPRQLFLGVVGAVLVQVHLVVAWPGRPPR